MRYLVTGGAGFIGSHVAEELVRRGAAVTVLDDLSGGFAENVPAGARLVEGSILDEALVQRLFRDERFEYVYHLAAYAAEGLSHFIRGFNYRNNLIGSMVLINQALRHDVRCFVFTSSIAVYGSQQTPMREEATPQPEDPYGIAKYAVELDLQAAHRLFGLNYLIFRPHNVYGERQNVGDRYRNVIGIFMNQVMRGEPMTIFGDGSQTRAFSYIGDVAPDLVAASLRPETYNQVFNVGGDEVCSVKDLAERVARVFGVRPAIRFLEARHEVAHAFASHDRLARFLGRRPTTPLDEGLRRMARWAQQHGPRQSRPFERIEVDRNLPPSWRAVTGAGEGGQA